MLEDLIKEFQVSQEQFKINVETLVHAGLLYRYVGTRAVLYRVPKMVQHEHGWQEDVVRYERGSYHLVRWGLETLVAYIALNKEEAEALNATT